MRAPWPGLKQRGCPFFFWPSPNLNMFVHTHFNRTLATNHNSVPVLINSFLSVQFTPFKSLFHDLCTNLDFFFDHLWKFSSHICLWIFRFDTVWGLSALNFAHISCRRCRLFASTTDPSFRASFSDNKHGLPLRISFLHFLSFKSLRTRYKVGGECLVWLAICDTLTFAVCNSTIAFYFLTTTALVFLSPLLNGLYID